MDEKHLVTLLATKLANLRVFNNLHFLSHPLHTLTKFSELLPAIIQLIDKQKAYFSPTQGESLAAWVEQATFLFIKHKQTKGLDWIIDNQLPFYASNLHFKDLDKINLYYQATLHSTWSQGMNWLLLHSPASDDDMDHALNYIGQHNHLHLLEPLQANMKHPFKVIRASYEACIRVGSFELYTYACTQKFNLTNSIYSIISTIRLLNTEIVKCQRFLDDHTKHLQMLGQLQLLYKQYQADMIALLSHKRGMSTPLILYILSWL